MIRLAVGGSGAERASELPRAMWQVQKHPEFHPRAWKTESPVLSDAFLYCDLPILLGAPLPDINVGLSNCSGLPRSPQLSFQALRQGVGLVDFWKSTPTLNINAVGQVTHDLNWLLSFRLAAHHHL